MKRHVRIWAEILLITVLYVCAGKVGLTMARLNASVSPVWPPTGLALAVLLIRGQRLWPAVFLGAFLVNLTTAHHAPELTWTAASLAIALGNTLEAVAGAWLVRRLAGGRGVFHRAEDVIRFICFAAIPSTALSATVGTGMLCLAGAANWHDGAAVWSTWWTGDFVSDLLVAPLVIILAGWPLPRYGLARLLEALAMAVATAVASWMTFRSAPPSVMSNLLLPLLLLAAFRFQQWGAIVTAAIMSAIATFGTLYGRGPFVTDNANSSLMLLQAFVGFRAVTALVLAAVVAERTRDRIEKEEALASERHARSDAERANRAKDEFLAVLSHELRTPLTPVLLTASLLEGDAQLPERLRADMRTIRENTALEARLIDDLLDHSRITRGKLKLEMQSVDVQKSVQRAAQICCADRAGDLTLALEASRPYVFGDPARLQQVFWNLLNNALKFTPAGRPITIRTFNPDPAILRVEVRDAGIGIEPDLVPRMFEAFEQGDARTIGKKSGLGLGLAITRALVEAHGGRVSAHSEGRDRGTTFIVDLAAHAGGGPDPSVSNGSVPRASARGLRVLLVEDHDGTRQAMIRLLEALGHQVTAVATMHAALARAQQATLDLVISDIGLPDADGLELMRRLRTLFAQRGDSVRAIAVSGYGMEQDIQASREAGFDTHLTKPVSPDRLASAIHQATTHLSAPPRPANPLKSTVA